MQVDRGDGIVEDCETWHHEKCKSGQAVTSFIEEHETSMHASMEASILADPRWQPVSAHGGLAEHEFALMERVAARLRSSSPTVELLGQAQAAPDGGAAPRLPILSFLVRCGERFLHYGRGRGPPRLVSYHGAAHTTMTSAV